MERQVITVLFTLVVSIIILINDLSSQVRIQERMEVGSAQQFQTGELRYFKLARDVMVNPFVQVLRACYPIKIIATGRVESNHKDKRFLSVMLGLGNYGNLTHRTDSVIVGCCGSTYIEVWTWSGCPITITDVQVEETGVNGMVFHFYGYQYCPHPVYPTFEAIVEVRAELLIPYETAVECSMISFSKGRLLSSGTEKEDKIRAVMLKSNGEGIQCCCGEVEFQLKPLIEGVELRSINERGEEERGSRVHSVYRNTEGADVGLVWDGQYRGWDSVDVEITANGFGVEGKTTVRLV